MTRFASTDDLEAAVGEHLGYGDWFTIDQRRIDLFADATADHQWIHVDPVRAADGPFGATVAHGFLTLSLVPVLTEDVFDVGGVSLGINYGLNRVRIPSAVRAGSRVRAGLTLQEVTRTAHGVQTVLDITVEIEGEERPAVVAEWVLLLVPDA